MKTRHTSPCGHSRNASAKRRKRLNAERTQKNSEIPWRPDKKDGSRGIFVYTAREKERSCVETMPIFSRLMFQAVPWAARRGLSRRGELFRGREKTASPAHRGSWGDICLLVFTAARVRVCSTKLCAARHEGRNRLGRLRRRDPC